MTKKLLCALILIGTLMVVLIFNRGSATVDFPFGWDISGIKSLVYFSFVALGVAIGMLLK